ncbi:11910_t:CDS:1, partial [Funneliformis caledonium]
YNDETPKMWCSRICVPFKKLLKYNPRIFLKNEYIHMTDRLYKNGKFEPGR